VWCENTGPLESVAILRGAEAWADNNIWPIDKAYFGVGQPMNSSKIDQQTHRWLVQITSPVNVQYSTGTHDVGWRGIYFDGARPSTHGYLTEETLTIDFPALGAPGTIKGPYWLDSTSTNETRYKRYWKYMAKAQGRRSLWVRIRRTGP
jgi:hypothetical protein